MGFYQVICSIFEGSAKFPKDPIRSVLVNIHLFEIINYHKRLVEEKNIKLPEMTEFYKNYINNWNEYILSKEPDLQAVVETWKIKDKRPSYVS